VSALSDVTVAQDLLERALAESPARLDWAALAIASLENDRLDVPAQEKLLEQLASRVRREIGASMDPLKRVQALRRVLGDEEGFRGNEDDYDDPENSFLDVVLERKLGLPITLSAVYLEVARRAGVPLFGVSFPGHFLVACEAGSGMLVVDPWDGGEILTEKGCEDLLKRVAPQLHFTPKMLVAASVRAISSRMLNNLKRVYLNREEGDRALKVVDLSLVLSPDHPGELRARASILSSLGAYRAALADVERCLMLSPHAPDSHNLELTARALKDRVEQLN
jgi:regulator of sirC expression with transglutaminase-like and TPR domain